MAELTGFRLQRVKPAKAWAEPTAAGRELGLTTGWGVGQPVEPLFAATDATAAETLATYPDGSAAVALRRSADGPSVFVGPPGLTSELLRLAARACGVHLFTEQDCNAYASGSYLVLHAAQDGPLQVNAGQTGAIVELLTGQPLGRGPRLTLPAKKGQTHVLLLRP
jgi:hypothetical protein